MKLALAQTNPVVGDFAGNVARIREMSRRAAAAGAQLVVFPELSICGYMPRDLLEEPSFLDACERALDEIAADRDAPARLVGCPLRAEGPGKPLVNAAVLVRGGERIVTAKRLLPTYDVFDERRYFRPGGEADLVRFGGTLLGVTICEDMWTGEHGQGLYEGDPVADLVEAGAHLVVNLSASPYARGKPAARRRIVEEHARRHKVPFAFVNMAGGNDQLIFDGNSFAVDGGGRLVAHGAAWGEDLVVTDMSRAARPPADGDDVGKALVLGIRDYFLKTGFADALVGLSGGVDSALTACLAVDALGKEHVTGVSMPGPFSAPISEEDARALATSLGIRFHVVPITAQYERMREALRGVWGEQPFGVAEENLQARLRGVVLMALANRQRALVLATSNKSEFAMGYATLYGDMVGALAPLTDLYKTEVYELAKRYPIPERTVTRAPTAELRPNQTDQDSLPPYEVLDGILRLHLEERLRPAEIVEQGYDAATVHRVLKAVSLAEYKRQQSSPVLKVTGKAFGLGGRRFPIVERFFGGAG